MGPKALSMRAAMGLAAIAGGLYFAGVPGVGAWPLALVAHAPLIVALRGQSPKRGAAVGFVFGLAVSATVFSWLFSTLQRFSKQGILVCALLTALLWTYQAGRGALAGWLSARAEERGYPSSVAFVIAYVTSELLYPQLFPWFFALAVADAPILLQTADLGGPYMVSLVLLAPSVLLAEIALARRERRRVSHRLIGGALVIAGFGLAYGGLRMGQMEARAKAASSVMVGVAQGNQPLLAKPESVRVHRKLTRDLREQGAEVVLWAEGAVSKSYPEETYREDMKRNVTGRLGVPVILGGGVRNMAIARETNTAMLADDAGNIVGRYDKKYLLPFGEFLPLESVFPSIRGIFPQAGRLVPGDTPAPLVLGDVRFAVLICYEDILPGYANSLLRGANADMIVNLTIDTWFGDSIEPWEHLGMAALRAVEHRKYLVRATNSGVSAFVDNRGKVVKHGGVFKEEALMAKVPLLRGSTVYELIGDIPFWVLAALSFVMAIVPRRRIVR